MQAVNPATGRLIREYDEHTRREIEVRLAHAETALAAWRVRPIAERAALMRAAAATLRRDADDHARLMTEEMGKPLAAARAEVEKCASACVYMADHAEGFLAPEPVATDAGESFVRFDPLGIVLAVMPWNFPFWQVFRFATTALMAGNVGVLKHASNVPGCALRIERIFREAGFPEGVFTTLLVGSEGIEAIVRDPRVAAMTLTGSERAGASVAAVAGSELKRSVLELGGSDPFVVLEDARLDAALEAAVTARTQNNGQSCIAAKRFIVHARHYDRFVEELASRFAACRMGDPMEDGCDIGPLAREDLVDILHDQVERSLTQGARLVTGGVRPAGPGFFYPPTVLAECVPGVAAFDEETFGPVAAVVRAADADEAIALANTSQFGLGASLWTEAARGKQLAPGIAAGHVAVNGIVKSDPRLPFGGVKRSGYGRELSRYGMLEFVNIKTVWIA
jgi:succinate-semialdehyde dehydrogenase/glutarate-semialdehyde dehydrogenase